MGAGPDAHSASSAGRARSRRFNAAAKFREDEAASMWVIGPAVAQPPGEVAASSPSRLQGSAKPRLATARPSAVRALDVTMPITLAP